MKLYNCKVVYLDCVDLDLSNLDANTTYILTNTSSSKIREIRNSGRDSGTCEVNSLLNDGSTISMRCSFYAVNSNSHNVLILNPEYETYTLDQLKQYSVAYLHYRVESNWGASYIGLSKSPDYGITRTYLKYQQDLITAKSETSRNRVRYTDSMNKYTEMQIKYEGLGKILSKMRAEYTFGTHGIVFKYTNVVAEDTDARGEDIELGDLTFELTLDGKVYLVDGSEPKRTDYNSNAFHPHHMSDGTVCLGSQSADMVQAASEFKFELAGIMISKFAHSYTSSDSAGKYWKMWTDDPHVSDEDEDDIYVPTRDGYYHDDQVRWSEDRDENIHEDDAIWSSRYDDYFYDGDEDETWHWDVNTGNEDVVRSEDAVRLHDGDYTHNESAIELHDGRYALAEDVRELYDGNYALDSEAIHIGDDQYALKSDTIELEDGTYALADDSAVVELTRGTQGYIGRDWTVELSDGRYAHADDVVEVDGEQVLLIETVVNDDGTLTRIPNTTSDSEDLTNS